MQLTENVLTYKVPSAAAGEVYIDIARSMSVVGRKLYRQQGLWTVLGVNVYCEATNPPNSGVPFEIAFSGAPRNWVTRNALVKGYEHWKQQQRETMRASSPSLKPKWMDFKVFLNEGHRVAFNAGLELIPTSGHMFGGSDIYMIGDDWVHSQIVYEVDDGAGHLQSEDPFLHILGPDNSTTNVGLIRQYQISRARVFSPDPAVPGAISDSIYTLMDEGIGEKIRELTDIMEDANDNPPYDDDDYPGGASNGIEPLLYTFGTNSSLTVKKKISLPGFTVPNGVMEIQWDADPPEGQTADLWIQLIIGDRRTY